MKPVHCLAALPVLAFYGGGWLAEHAGPRLFGLPFLMAWNVVWLWLTAAVMIVMFRFDGSRQAGNEASDATTHSGDVS